MLVKTADEMHQLGKKIGSHLKAGDLVLLNGPLGAGKTVLVQGIAEALGIEEVTSPTFVISRIHQGATPLVHVDTYRLLESGKADLYLDDVDLDSELESAVTVIEWGGAESARLNESRLEITIDRTTNEREVTISPIGPRWAGFSL